jgi:hypothetical protein
MPALTPALLDALVPDWSEWPVFVETGTYRCQTILAMEPLFDELHTIELGEEFWKSALHQHSGRKIQFHLGDSATRFTELLPSLRRPAIFFLDGHWSCGDTARGSIDVPVYEELNLICGLFAPAAIVIIDDVRLFGQGPRTGEPVDWTDITTEEIAQITLWRRSSLEMRNEHDKLVVRLSPLATSSEH